MNKYRLEGIYAIMKLVGILLIIFLITKTCNAQDTTQPKKPFSFKQVLENRQKKLDKILEREKQAESLQFANIPEDKPYKNMIDGAGKIGGGAFILIAANIANLYITNPDTQKYVTIGSGVVGGSLIIIGTTQIADAFRIFQKKQTQF